ncbi:MAG: hypothetical protein ACR2FY_24385 [Pirellulaceae bacterium]
MSKIVLTSEQAEALGRSDYPIAICRPDGSPLAFITKSGKVYSANPPVFSAEEVAAAEREADTCTTWYTTAEILERLNKLGAP